MNPKSMIITGGRVIDPAQDIDRLADVLICDGRIVDVTDLPMVEPPDGYDVVDATGLVVSPGFVDLHTHLREPGFEHKETIETGTRAAATGGFTTICAMPNTEPALDSPDSIAAMLRRAERVATIRVLPIGAITIGRAGQTLSPMEELAEAGCIGFSDDGDPVSDDSLMRAAQERAGVLGLPIINHAEVHSLVQDGVMNDGNVAKRLGLPGVPSVAESLMVQRDLEMAKSTGGRVHVPHLSVNQSIEHVFRAKDAGLRVTAEVTPHHLTLTEDWVYGLHGASPPPGSEAGYDTNTRVNPPLRSEEDRQAVIGALRDGVIDVIATDHAPHSPSEKGPCYESAANGINVLETAFGSLCSLVDEGAVALPLLIERLTSGPAKILGRKLGSLYRGWPADIVLIDPSAEWIVEPDEFASLSRNTPLAGVRLRGRVVTTIFMGQVIHDLRGGCAD